MIKKSVSVRALSFAAATAAFGLLASGAQAHQVLQRFGQAEQRAPNGRITVEASTISVIQCNGAGERGGQYYIYQYVNRPGFRAILPPNWGSPLGGRDWQTYAEAANAACYSAPPVAAAGTIAGRWFWGTTPYDVTQNGNAFRWTLPSNPEIGQGTISGNTLSAGWTGGGTATGKIVQWSSAGYPNRVEWSNGAVWTR